MGEQTTTPPPLIVHIGMRSPNRIQVHCDKGWSTIPWVGLKGSSCDHGGGNRIVYSNLVGYQTSDIRLLWTITPNPPPPPPAPQHPFYLPPPPPPCQTSPPPPPVSPSISDLSHCHLTLEV